MNHKYVTFCCLLLNMLFISVAYFGRGMGPSFTMLTILAVALSILGVIMYSKRAEVAATPSFAEVKEPGLHSMTKVVSINTDAAVAEN
jgi:Na+-transporting methylmalonyl-CoA/oxaloacetate decarboxylase gamma subunit